jgi:spore maturation protein CgeB
MVQRICSKCHGPLEKNRYRRYRYCRKCHAEYMKATRPKHSELSPEARMKANVRAIAKYHLRAGRIEQEPCEVCGAFDSQMHHDDYTKPKEVRWLCRRHHLKVHGHKPK